ncbi:MAG: 4'-phosphopantetheinyl transferase superfamily protein [Bacteroidia bacterium]|nr:4'-phosphopantetheinyl transferase superfamily protein [Bacteroidia bacterium]
MDGFQLHSGIPHLDPLVPGEVHIFFSLMGESLQRNNSQLLLSQDEKERLKMYRTNGKRNEFLFGRLLMRKLLGEMMDVSPKTVPIAINEHRRPYLKGHQLHFNLSHSFGGFAFIASVAHEVGIDIEYRKRSISLEDGRHVFMPAEKSSMAAKEAAVAKDEFLHRWTLKEAIYKSANVGPQLLFNEFELKLSPLSLHSHSLLLEEEGWELGHAYPHPDYLLAFAFQNPAATPLSIHFHQILL